MNPEYRTPGIVHQQDDTLRVFPVQVMRVDYERHVISVKNLNDHIVYDEVDKFPAPLSSFESTDDGMPEQGQSGLGIFQTYTSGYVTVVVLTWTSAGLVSKIDSVAHRPSSTLEGYSTRWRGSHRKPYPGQRSKTLSLGLHEFEGAGWDRIAADFSQDKLDTDRRQWLQTTGRTVTYNDGGLRFSGSVQRPGADTTQVPEEILPDGTTRQIVYLTEAVDGHDRYVLGTSDMLPMAEVMEKVQEFALDYPVPYEVLESPLLDTILGTQASPWARTVLSKQGTMSIDDQEFTIDQDIDHPTNPAIPALGPTTGEGNSPRRRGWIMEKVAGTVVGYNAWDASTYGHVLKPSLWMLSNAGRFGTDTETGFLPVKASKDHAEARMAATAFLMRFPYEYNTTRLEVTKEGMVLMEVGATIPRENISFDIDPTTGMSIYEHPWGAGRSLEANLVGSAKIVIGKNRDEEDSLDLATLGQVVLRLGSDDASLPQAGRQVRSQNRGRADAVVDRDINWWTQDKAKLVPGDALSLDALAKVGAESVSLRAAFDGGTLLRLGARDPRSRRRHLMNGYVDGQGHTQAPPGQGTRARSKGRQTYGAGDSHYQFNDLTKAGLPQTNPPLQPYFYSGDPVGNPDVHGLSLDVHACRDIFLRVGKNQLSGQSILIDLEGGIVGIVGKDSKGRSLTGSLQGGIELTVGSQTNGQAIQLEIIGDVNMAVQGNFHMFATGDITFDAMGSIYHLPKKEHVVKATNIRNVALNQHVIEAPDIVAQQGGIPPTYSSIPPVNSTGIPSPLGD